MKWWFNWERDVCERIMLRVGKYNFRQLWSTHRFRCFFVIQMTQIPFPDERTRSSSLKKIQTKAIRAREFLKYCNYGWHHINPIELPIKLNSNTGGAPLMHRMYAKRQSKWNCDVCIIETVRSVTPGPNDLDQPTALATSIVHILTPTFHQIHSAYFQIFKYAAFQSYPHHPSQAVCLCMHQHASLGLCLLRWDAE